MERGNVTFTAFILFQLFNAFNSRELGAESILKGIGRNKIMVITFISVFALHVFMVQVCSSIFGVNPMVLISWIKVLALTLSIIVVCEIYKFLYRKYKSREI